MNLAASLTSELVELFKESTTKMSMAHLGKLGAECGENVPDTEVRLAHVKSGYMMWIYIPTMNDVDLKNVFIREPVKYGTKLHRVFTTDSSVHLVRKRTVLC